MGIPNSKFGKEIAKSELQEGILPSTPILTPKTNKISEMDPRSPSLHISRTPLEVLAVEDKMALLDDTPVRNKIEIQLGIDPRSPTTDFKRTPIIINMTEGDYPRKLLNKNLDKARQSEIITSSVSSSEMLKTSPSAVIRPKLLQSSPIKPRPDVYKRRSLVGLLETNIDFTETDLDRVLEEKCTIQKTGKYNEDIDKTPTVSGPSDSVNAVEDKTDSQVLQEKCIIQNPEPNNEDIDKTPTVHGPSDSVNVDEDKADGYIISANEMLESQDPEEPKETETDIVAISTDIDSTEINKCVQLKNDTELETTNSMSSQVGQISAANDILIQTKSAPVTPPNIPLSPILPTKEIKSAPVTPPLANLTANVKELDKKLTNLIYEDNLVVCPRIVKLKDTNERSPLRSCNGNETRVKSGQKLKVSDKPRRADYAVSKIPVFKEIRSKVKNEVQCENTPPRNMEKKKIRHRSSDWDTKDNTLYL